MSKSKAELLNEETSEKGLGLSKKEKLNAIDVLQADDNYVTHTGTLNSIVIDKRAKDIRKELKKPVKKKKYEQVTLEDMPF